MNTTPICDIIRDKIKELNWSSTLEKLLELIRPIEEEREKEIEQLRRARYEIDYTCDNK